jgi:hypothetical protein
LLAGAFVYLAVLIAAQLAFLIEKKRGLSNRWQ